MCRTSRNLREADALREETGRSTGGAPRGTGPVTSARIAEIMSGRSIHQQGPAATCKDLAHKADGRKREEVDGLAREPVGAMKEG